MAAHEQAKLARKKVKVARGVTVDLASYPEEHYVALRPISMMGRHCVTGDRVHTDGLPVHKIAQLIELRMMKMVNKRMDVLEAARAFTCGGQTFSIGDKFPIEGLQLAKVTQLLEHRYIQPTATA